MTIIEIIAIFLWILVGGMTIYDVIKRNKPVSFYVWFSTYMVLMINTIVLFLNS